MRLPDFLLIGAMKAGTTSLCRDLETHPMIFFPSVKEPHTLCLNEVLTPEGRTKYAALFERARPDQQCGEGSTGYSKLPSHRGVPLRAKQAIGDDLKLIYIVREPVARAISHHYHLYRAGDASDDFFKAVKQIPSIIDTSRYAMQVEPWIEAYGTEKVCVVRFEDYIRDRAQLLTTLWTFLGVGQAAQAVAAHTAHNVGEEQLLPPRNMQNLVRKVTRSQWYKRVVHPRTPQWVRERLKSSFYQEAPERPAPPSLEAVDYVLERLQRDWERLPDLLGREEAFWDMGAVRDRFRKPEMQVE